MFGFSVPPAANAPSVLIVAGIIGIFLIGTAIGCWFGRRRQQATPVGSDQRETVLQLLTDLDGLTRRYSGDLSQHQTVLDSLSEAVSSDDPAVLGDRAVALLNRIIQSNNQLKQKLSTAESQLDEKSQHIKEYLAEARTDALTGLANRRALDQRLEELFGQYRRGGRSFVVALIDIDHFKLVNDRHGHAEGDRVLTDFAITLRRELADAWLVARFGGEEFAVILAGPVRQSAERMEQLRNRIANQVQHAGAAELRLTISVGLSEPLDDIGAASIVRRADEALYAAKHIGRNRVYFHDGREPTLVGAPEVVS